MYARRGLLFYDGQWIGFVRRGLLFYEGHGLGVVLRLKASKEVYGSMRRARVCPSSFLCLATGNGYGCPSWSGEVMLR